MQHSFWALFFLLLTMLVGCKPTPELYPPPPTPEPTPGVVSLRTDQASYPAGEGEIQLVVQNATGEPVYLPMCGPWKIFRLIGAEPLSAWELNCDQDFIAYELPAGRSVAGVISLSDPAATPNYLAATPGDYRAELMVYSNCDLGEAIMVETGPKYGEFEDCAHQQHVLSPQFRIEDAVLPPPTTTPQADTKLPPTPPPAVASLEQLGQIGGVVQAIAWNNGMIAAGIGPRLFLFDPAELKPIGKTKALPALLLDVALEGDRAYLATGVGGLWIADISDPAAPIIVGSFQPDGVVRNVAAAGEYLLLAAGPAGFWILDVADPSDPTPLSHLETGQPANAVTVTPGLAYLLLGEKLQVLDVSNPTTPTPLGEVELAGGGRRVLVSGSVAYVAAERQGVHVIDLADPTAPALTGTLPPQESVMALALTGETLLAADYRAGLTLYNTTALTVTGRLDTPGVAMGLAVHSGRVVLADYGGGIRQINIEDPAAPQQDRPPYQTLGWVNAVSVQDRLAVLAGTAGLGLVEVSDPSAPVQLFVQPDVPWVSEDVALGAGRAYVVENSVGLRIFDLTTPPAEVGGYQVDRARAVTLHHGMVYLAHQGGLAVLDVGAMPPTLVSSFAREWEAADLLATDETLYMADAAGSVWVLDISNPAFPVEAGRWEQPAHGLALGGYFLVAAAGPKGLRTAAIGEPARPIEVGRLLTGDARSVLVLDQIAFMADASAGVYIVGLQDPAEPLQLGLEGTAGTAVDIATDGEWLYVADAAGGLLIYGR